MASKVRVVVVLALRRRGTDGISRATDAPSAKLHLENERSVNPLEVPNDDRLAADVGRGQNLPGRR